MRFFFVFFFIVFLLSCKNDSLIDSKETVLVDDIFINNIEDKKHLISTNRVKLHSEARKVIENWQEYHSVSEFMPKFHNTSVKGALINSMQFYELSAHLKDSIRVKHFDNPSFKIRLNVLNNQALRLFDMDSIPNITNKEVIKEVNNIINAYNSINIKINNMVKRNILTKDLSGFDHVFNHLDSLQIKPIENSVEDLSINPKKHFKLNKKK